MTVSFFFDTNVIIVHIIIIVIVVFILLLLSCNIVKFATLTVHSCTLSC